MIIVVEDDKGEVIARIPTDEGSRFEIIKKGYRVTRYKKGLPKLKWNNGKLMLVRERVPLWQQGGQENAGIEGMCKRSQYDTGRTEELDAGVG